MERVHQPASPSIRRRGAAVVALAVALLWVGRTPACDICAVYTATEGRESRTGILVGVGEQYTHFGTLQQGGHEVANPAGQRLDSSITQLLLGYRVSPRFAGQLNLPFIARTFRRPEGDRIVDGAEGGVGDMALTAQVLVHHFVTEQSVFRFSLLGGIKFPTGDPDRLEEEAEEDHEHPTPGVPESGIHGHDLALGSGSFDGIVGGQVFYSWNRLLLTASGQYAIRTEGAFDYRYANDLTWNVGPGVFALLAHSYALRAQAVFSGETKGKDEQGGVPADDTGTTVLYLGPALNFTWGEALVAEVAADLPVVRHNTALQIVPDFRVRAGVTWRFG